MLQKIIKSLKKDKKFMEVLKNCRFELTKGDTNGHTEGFAEIASRDMAALTVAVCHHIVNTLLEEKVRKPKKKKK